MYDEQPISRDPDPIPLDYTSVPFIENTHILHFVNNIDLLITTASHSNLFTIKKHKNNNKKRKENHSRWNRNSPAACSLSYHAACSFILLVFGLICFESYPASCSFIRSFCLCISQQPNHNPSCLFVFYVDFGSLSIFLVSNGLKFFKVHQVCDSGRWGCGEGLYAYLLHQQQVSHCLSIFLLCASDSVFQLARNDILEVQRMLGIEGTRVCIRYNNMG
ncbi:uncharacterized protein LOC126584456 [Malus sylvestris]|uniref:uncharacterized protein LOC126584456 n=1 Tax=Malus sylvestris TaxID=3752 RepID=UPI0021ABC77A|nr:uncharacterized protein LOC126584456 [Malus sylvestris]